MRGVSALPVPSRAAARRAVLLGALALVAQAPGTAAAHGRSVSHSSVELDGAGARVVLRVAQLELTRLPWGTVSPPALDSRLARYVTGRLRLVAGSEPCPVVDGPRALAGPAETARIEWRVACPDTAGLRIESTLFRDVAPTHIHFVRLHRPASRPLERVLSRAEPAWALGDASGARSGRGATGAGTSLGGYLALGVEHILTGADHLAFLLALILIARRLGEVAAIVTGFTIAHSLTLVAAALGWVEPHARTVEALIGLSIALVAAENAWWLSGRGRALPVLLVGGLGLATLLSVAGVGAPPAVTLAGLAIFSAAYFALLERARRPVRLRAAVAFAFGLVHGFGFAGVLAELALPAGRVVPALFGFNLGVELGQLGALVLLWPLLRLSARVGGGRPHRWLAETGSAAVCALGLFWFVTRAYG